MYIDIRKIVIFVILIIIYTDMKNEKWAKIPGRERSHIVSNYGVVKSIDRWITNIDGKDLFLQGKELYQSKDGNGYPTIGLSWDGKVKHFTIHRLVWDVFSVQERKRGLDVDHMDENKENNYIGNLQLITHNKNTKKRSEYQKTGIAKILGVHRISGGKEKPWRTSIMCNKKRTHLGYFKTIEEAKAEYERADKEYQETGTVTKIFKSNRGPKTKMT